MVQIVIHSVHSQTTIRTVGFYVFCMSVSIDLCCGIFSDSIITNFLLILAVK